MKKLFIGVGMVLMLGLVANVAFSDETVPFPYWQHGWTLQSFWSCVNAGATDVTITIEMYKSTDGLLNASTVGTLAPDEAWLPDTSVGSWYTDQVPPGDQNAGAGLYKITSAHDNVYLWGCVYSYLVPSGQGQPGFTVVMPGNPYGL